VKASKSKRSVKPARRSGAKKAYSAPRPRRVKVSKSKRSAKLVRGKKTARNVAIKIVINALEKAGYDTSDIDLEQLYEDLE